MPIGFPWIVLAVGTMAVLAAVLVLRARRSKRVLPPSQTMVALLRKPEPLDTRLLASLFSLAAGCPVSPAGPIPQRRQLSDPLPPGDWVAGTPPTFLAKIGPLQILVSMHEARYIADPSAPPWSIANPEMLEAVAAHTAWLAIEIIVPERATEADYRTPARVLAALLKENCLALYFHSRARFALYTDGTKSSLRGNSPVQAVFGPFDDPTAPTPSH